MRNYKLKKLKRTPSKPSHCLLRGGGFCGMIMKQTQRRFSMFIDELKSAIATAICLGLVFFTVPIAFVGGVNVAQRIGFIECVSPSVQK